MKKYFTTLLLALVGTCAAWANDMVYCLVLELNAEEAVTLALSESPKMKFEGTDVILTAKGFEGRYARTDVQRMYFQEVPSGIKTLESLGDRKQAGVIYDINGRKVAEYNGTIETSNLPQGVYVIKTESGKSFKVTRN